VRYSFGTPRLRLALAAALLPLISGAAPAFAQSIADELSRTAAGDNIGKGFQTIAILGQVPGTSSTTLEGDDVEVDTHRLHLQHRFTRRDGAGNAIVSPFVEFTLGGAKADESILSPPGGPDVFRLDLRFRSRSLLLGGGASIPLGVNTQVTPMLLAGRSSLKINSVYTGPNAVLINQLFDGLLNRAKIESIVLGPALQVDHRSMVLRGSRLTAVGRYNHLFNLSNDVTDPGLEPRGSVGVASALVRLETPTKLYVGERELFAGPFVRGNWLSGAADRQFGFDTYGEVGGTLSLDYPTQRGLGIGLYGSLMRGSGVKGHSFGVTIRFAGIGSGGPH